ncbi:MAG: caspase family protein [Cyanobacteriota/Melainabacteria group bacterium]
MKKAHIHIFLLSFIFLISAGVKPAAAQNRPVDDKWALIIGISRFKDPSMDLKYPAKDATDFRDYLVKEAGFSEDHVKLITDAEATRAGILSAIGDKWLPRTAQPNDLVVIYISSHGSPSKMDNEGSNYIIAHDTKKDELYATGISLQNLASMIKDRVHCDRVLVILDACHSGAAGTKKDSKGLTRVGGFDVGNISMGQGMMIVCSSQPAQVSWESKNYQNGVFTRQLIDALKYRGKYTKLGEAFDIMKKGVQTEVLKDRGELQSPVIKSAWKGDDLVLGSKPVSPRQGIKQDPVPRASSVDTTNLDKGAPQVASSTPLAAEIFRPPSSDTDSSIQGQQINVSLLDRVAILPVTGPQEILLDANWEVLLTKTTSMSVNGSKRSVDRDHSKCLCKHALEKRLKNNKPVVLLKFDNLTRKSIPAPVAKAHFLSRPRQ